MVGQVLIIGKFTINGRPGPSNWKIDSFQTKLKTKTKQLKTKTKLKQLSLEIWKL